MKYQLLLIYTFISSIAFYEEDSVTKFKNYYDSLNISNIIKYNEKKTLSQTFPNKYDSSFNFNDPFLQKIKPCFILEETSFYNNISNHKLVIRIEISSSAKDYKKGASIYEHLDIVKGKQNVIFLDDKDAVIGISFNFTLPSGYFSINNDLCTTNKDKKALLKRAKGYQEIIEYKPEVIMASRTFNIKHKTFLFIKNSKIYVYRYNRHKKYELNEYINKFFKPCTIRKLAEHSKDMKAVMVFGLDKNFLKCN